MISRIFLRHPRLINETYFEHMAFASWFALKLFAAAFAALLHALIPCCFEKTASSIIAELYRETRYRGQGTSQAAAPSDQTKTSPQS